MDCIIIQSNENNTEIAFTNYEADIYETPVFPY